MHCEPGYEHVCDKGYWRPVKWRECGREENENAPTEGANPAAPPGDLMGAMSQSQDLTSGLEALNRRYEQEKSQRSAANDMATVQGLSQSMFQAGVQQNLATQGQAGGGGSNGGGRHVDAHGLSQACAEGLRRLESHIQQCKAQLGTGNYGICETARLGFECMKRAEQEGAGCPEAVASARQYQDFYQRQMDAACSSAR